MSDFSLYEKKHRFREEQAFGICLGKIISVNTEERVCKVATMFGSGVMEDQYIERCQWLCADAHPDGDESGSIPRRGAIGLVFFVQGEPFIWGYLRPLSKGGVAAKGGESPTLSEGDKIMSTKSGNRIACKRSGLIELHSKDTLRRAMIPLDDKIMDICGKFELKCSEGGLIRWGADNLTGFSNYRGEYLSATNALLSFAMLIERGHVTPDIVSRVSIGKFVPYKFIAAPSYKEEIKATGDKLTYIGPPMVGGVYVGGYKSEISPLGDIAIKAGTAQNVSMSVAPTGATEYDVNKLAKVSISDAGDVSIKHTAGGEMSVAASGEATLKNNMCSAILSPKGDVTIKAAGGEIVMSFTGEVTIKSNLAMNINAGAPGLNIKSLGPLSVDSTGPLSIKSKGMVSIDGGSGVLEKVLTSPSTVSHFTGAPLMPGSQTVAVSI